MARSNPNKRKREVAKRRVFVACEGDTEDAFMNHVKSIYNKRGCGTQVKIKVSPGGSPEAIIKWAQKQLTNIAYTVCLIVMDTDVPWPSSRPRSSHGTKINYCGSTPCIEGFLLELLESPKQYKTWTSDKCRRRFHKQYLNEDDKLVSTNYDRIFKKEQLEVMRVEDQRLNGLIKLFEGDM